MNAESLLENIKRSILDETEGDKEKKFYGVTVGTVINPVDFLTLGRVQVLMPKFDDLIAFARVASPMGGIFHGDYFIPNVGDEVLLAFEDGDINAPYIIGSVWNMIQRPPLPTPLPQIRTIRTLVGNQIVFTEAPPSVTIQTGPTSPVPIPSPPSPVGPHQTLMMSPLGISIMGQPTISLQTATSSIIITAAGITLQAGSNTIAITPAGIFLQSGQCNISLAGGNIGILGPMVRINS